MTGAAFLFAVATLAMLAAALAFVVVPLWRGAAARGPERKACNVAVYRSALAEVHRERGEGRIDEAEHRAVSDDIARRLLEDVRDEPSPRRGRSPTTALIVAVVLPLVAAGLYARFGNPSLLAVAPLADAVVSDGDTRQALVAHLARERDDGRAWVTLARLDVESERYADAARSFEKALAASAKIARDAGVWCELADALGMANGGRLAGRPTELVQHALQLDASHPQALEMAGSAAYERMEYRAAAMYWRQLAAQLDVRSRSRAELESAIARAERLGATRLPAAAPPGRS